jgi:hypothetical protein
MILLISIDHLSYLYIYLYFCDKLKLMEFPYNIKSAKLYSYFCAKLKLME